MIEDFCENHGNFDGLFCPLCYLNNAPITPKPIPFVWCAFAKTPKMNDVFQAYDLEGNLIFLQRIN